MEIVCPYCMEPLRTDGLSTEVIEKSKHGNAIRMCISDGIRWKIFPEYLEICGPCTPRVIMRHEHIQALIGKRFKHSGVKYSDGFL